MEDLLIDLKSSKDWHGILAIGVDGSNLKDDFTFEQALRCLSISLQNKILSKRTIHSRNISLCNHLLQMFGCSLVSWKSAGELRIKYGKYGKPYLENDEDIAFSMSNGEKYVIQYILKTHFRDTEVGADIASKEDYKGEDDIVIFRDIFSNSEYENLRAQASVVNQKKIFTHYWALKESYTKLTGTGLNCDLSSLDFGELAILEQPTVLETNIENKLIRSYSQWIDGDRDEIITVCHNSTNKTNESLSPLPKLYKISINDILTHLNQKS